MLEVLNQRPVVEIGKSPSMQGMTFLNEIEALAPRVTGFLTDIDNLQLHAAIKEALPEECPMFEQIEKVLKVFEQAADLSEHQYSECLSEKEAMSRMLKDYKDELHRNEKELERIDALVKPPENWKGNAANLARSAFQVAKLSKGRIIQRNTTLNKLKDNLEQEIQTAEIKLSEEKENCAKRQLQLGQYEQLLVNLFDAYAVEKLKLSSAAKNLPSVEAKLYNCAAARVREELVQLISDNLPTRATRQLRDMQSDLAKKHLELAGFIGRAGKDGINLSLEEKVAFMRKCRQFEQFAQLFKKQLEIESAPISQESQVENFEVHKNPGNTGPLLFIAKIDFSRVAKDEFAKSQIRKAAESGVTLRDHGSVGFKEFNGGYKLKLLGQLGNSRLFGHLDTTQSPNVWTAEAKLTKNGHSNRLFN